MSLCALTWCLLALPPAYLEDRFELPAGFRIYKVAAGDLCGGSYDITFDGIGRLLVGDGRQVRRLKDSDGDAVYDGYEVIATGLGGRGPQGLAVVGDRLFAVGGDGVQLYEGYLRQPEGPQPPPESATAAARLLTHAGRVGAPFNTGGDHAAHTIFRGHDDHLYFITGDGGGVRDRVHITEEASPARIERAASVFRISPDGRRWECIGTGGRNPPNLGMNYLGDLFSLDSDMEWHVDLPWWRPVRLHHWTAGGDQGWQSVGAYPPYYLDAQAGIYDVGRGSPDWGIFYEHDQFPARYRDAYFVCDYRSKSATTGGYDTTGRLFVFFLERDGPSWRADMEVFAMPRTGARDGDGRRLDFALVDVDVGPDGSLYLSDRGQGVWRIFYDPDGNLGARGPPPIVPRVERPRRSEPGRSIEDLLALPQPLSERSRLERERLRTLLGEDYTARLAAVATDSAGALRRRLRALRYLAPLYAELPGHLVRQLADDATPEVRGQAAWLMGIRGRADEAVWLAEKLAPDPDPFVRRRALEALTRNRPPRRLLDRLLDRLEDSERLVRYVAMVALSHHSTAGWFAAAKRRGGIQTLARALVAADLGAGLPERREVSDVVRDLIREAGAERTKEDLLDVLRVLGRFRRLLEDDTSLRPLIRRHLVERFPDADRDIRWEQARLIGEYAIESAFPKLLSALESETDDVTRFHLAAALARLPGGWSAAEEARAVAWFLRVQRGWFSDFAGKGRQFPEFWATVLAQFVDHHRGALRAVIDEIELTSQLGGIVLDQLADAGGGTEVLIGLYRRAEDRPEARARILRALGRVPNEAVSGFLREEFDRSRHAAIESASLLSLARQPPYEANRPYLEDGILRDDPAVVRASALSLARFRPEVTQDVLQAVITRMVERRDVFRACERLLVAMTGRERPGYSAAANPRRGPRDSERNAALGFWRTWYAEQFGEEFRPFGEEALEERTNDEVRRFLLAADWRAGNVEPGARTYEALCVRCHGGVNKGEKVAAVFGPDLAGITRRLNREELADALVDPSKSVPERYRSMVVQLVDGTVLTGFLTAERDRDLTLVTEERVQRIPKESIALTAAQEASLMPEGLLNRLTWDEIRDLLAFLEEKGAGEAEREREEESSLERRQK